MELKLQIASEYRMPPLCCACGAPPGKAKFKVYAVSAWRHRPYHLYVPLCDECTRAYEAVDRRRRVGCSVGLPLAVLLGLAAILVPALGGDDPWGLVLTMLAALALLGGIITFLALPLFLPGERRTPYQRVVSAARIRHYSPAGFLGDGSLVLCLAHPAFAEQFLQLNTPALWREPSR